MSDNEKSQSHWYVLQTKPNAEIGLSELIDANTAAGIWNIQCYLPILKQGAKTLPMFKGYLFVYHDERGFHQLNYQTGVKGYVRFGGMPSQICLRDIELMHQVEAHFNGVNSVDAYLVKGMKVRITTGVLAGRTGVLMDSPKGKKVALEIENLGRSLLVQVPPSDLLVLPCSDQSRFAPSE
ncbi:transcription termination/antitermination NusG family protein [uncultured Shewanella sp.]|uniref:transcription termination/antitermination protein NusG n=1 Tax=uncultured Shewanella sp. TaxID=173975 RepID=UPI00262BA47F|nr:transcription termination/antitermination NusG family protein [uncultured Shewanella sp.]